MEIFKKCNTSLNIIKVKGTATIEDFVDLRGYLEQYELDCIDLLDLKELKVKNLPNYFLEVFPDIKELILPYDLVAIPRYLCFSNTSLERVELGPNIKTIETSAFFCTKIKKITISPSVKNIAISAFRYCSKLEKVKYDYANTKIHKDAFVGCDALKEFVGYEEDKSM